MLHTEYQHVSARAKPENGGNALGFDRNRPENARRRRPVLQHPLNQSFVDSLRECWVRVDSSFGGEGVLVQLLEGQGDGKDRVRSRAEKGKEVGKEN
jgi:hypothetical protein